MNDEFPAPRLRIAIIGCGAIAKSHVDAFRGVGLEVTDIAAAPNSSRVKIFSEENMIPNVWANPMQLINEGDWDGLLITSSIDSTFKLLQQSISRNIPILVEKPVAERSIILSQLDLNNPKVMVGYNRRFYPAFQEMKKILEFIGPSMITVEIPEVIDNSSSDNPGRFKNVRKNSVHIFDLIRFLAGDIEVLSIERIGLNEKNPGTIAIFRSHFGHLISVTMNYNASSNFKISIDNGARRYEFNPLEEVSIYEGLNILESKKGQTIRIYKPNLISRGRSDPAENIYKPGFSGQANSFRKMIQGEEANSHATLQDALEALKIAEALAPYE